jgi:hypothetical protein
MRGLRDPQSSKMLALSGQLIDQQLLLVKNIGK